MEKVRPLPEPAPQIPSHSFWRYINLYVYVSYVYVNFNSVQSRVHAEDNDS